MNLLADTFPHLDAVVNGSATTPAIAPAYRPDLPFRCRSAQDRGTRNALTVDREAEWTVLSGPVRDGPGVVARFLTQLGLRVRVDVKARAEDSLVEAHALATGLMADFITADRRGVSATTGILALFVTFGKEVTYSPVASEDDGPPVAIIMTIEFTLMHGDC